MANIMFNKGLRANLPSSHSEGTFYITTDERAIYLDIDDSTRIRLGDFQEFGTLEQLKANVNPNTTALYYISDINCLAKWNGTEYIQINPDTGMTSVEVIGDGNVVTAAAYDPETRKLTLTRGFKAADAEFVGAIPEGYTETTVIDYINKKAAETLEQASGGSSESAASVLEALNNYKTVTDPRLEALEKTEHEHDNKTELDLIENGDKTKWDKVVSDLADEVNRAKAAETEINGKLGTVPADKTIVEMIADAQETATYDDTQVKANTEAIDVLNGSGEGSVDKKITDAFNKFATDVTDDGVINSYKELIDWAAEHGGDAAEMAGAITALENILDGIGGDSESATVVAYVKAAIDALNIGDYAKAAEMAALADRVTAIENKSTAWDAAEQNAKDYADSLNSAMDTRVKALEEIDHDAYIAADEAVLTKAKEYTNAVMAWGSF